MVTLTLTNSEAEALSAVLNMIGGHPDTSGRGQTQKVADKLRTAGVKRGSHKFEVVADTIWFKNDDGTGADPSVRYLAELFTDLVGR